MSKVLRYPWKIKRSSEASSYGRSGRIFCVIFPVFPVYIYIKWYWGNRLGSSALRASLRCFAWKNCGSKLAAAPVGLLWFCQYFGPRRNYFSKIGVISHNLDISETSFAARPFGPRCFAWKKIRAQKDIISKKDRTQKIKKRGKNGFQIYEQIGVFHFEAKMLKIWWKNRFAKIR